MIYLHDIPCLPSGVLVRERDLHDTAFGQRYPLNDTGLNLLEFVDGRRSIAEIAHLTASTFKVPVETVSADALAFFSTLNRAFLINMQRVQPWRRVWAWLWLVFRYPRTLTLVRWQQLHRSDLDLKSGVLSIATILSREILIVYGWWMAALSAWFWLQGWTAGVVLSAVFLVSVLVHELGHLAALRLTGNLQDAVFIGRRLLTVAIYRRKLSPRAEAVTAAGGPLLAGLGGLVLVLFGRHVDAQLLWVSGTVFLLHLVTLLPMAQDGQNLLSACRQRLKGE